jgi:hypothetical protein
VRYINYVVVAACTVAGLFIGQACGGDPDRERAAADRELAEDSALAEGRPLPRMHAIPTDTTSGPIEHVRGFRIFQAGDCTVWRFQDSVGIHYLAEGRTPTYSTSGKYVACSVAR